jgi:hypothetical protein
MKLFLIPLVTTVALALSLSTARAQDCPKTGDLKPTVVEVVTFKLAPGMTDEKFMAIVAEMEKLFICKTPGFIRRTIAKADNGLWFDYVEWADMKSASGAMESAMKDKGAEAFVQAMSPDGMNQVYWTIQKQTP